LLLFFKSHKQQQNNEYIIKQEGKNLP